MADLSEIRFEAIPRTECERLFVAEQPTIKSAVAQVARRYRLSRDETEELASEVALKLIERDYAVLRKSRGSGNPGAYLSAVVRHLALDSRTAKWGKWRASAGARRMGPAAVAVEELVGKRGIHWDRACSLVESQYGRLVDREALRALSAPPRKAHCRTVYLDDLKQPLPAADNQASALWHRTCVARGQRAIAALAHEIDSLPEADRYLIRRRFYDGASIVSIARSGDCDARMLYRRIARLFDILRQRLERRGINHAQLREWLVE
jgi:DNA-directed RNA polymerase specialized sigma24 family protein